MFDNNFNYLKTTVFNNSQTAKSKGFSVKSLRKLRVKLKIRHQVYYPYHSEAKIQILTLMLMITLKVATR